MLEPIRIVVRFLILAIHMISQPTKWPNGYSLNMQELQLVAMECWCIIFQMQFWLFSMRILGVDGILQELVLTNLVNKSMRRNRCNLYMMNFMVHSLIGPKTVSLETIKQKEEIVEAIISKDPYSSKAMDMSCLFTWPIGLKIMKGLTTA